MLISDIPRNYTVRQQIKHRLAECGWGMIDNGHPLEVLRFHFLLDPNPDLESLKG